jgi:dCTP diphosphatase
LNIEKIKKILKSISGERHWDQYHSPKNLSMALNVEASELMEIFQWLTEEESYNLNENKLENVKDELADIAIYLLRICMKYDINLEEAIYSKLEKFEKKYPVDKSKGNAKKYTEF